MDRNVRQSSITIQLSKVWFSVRDRLPRLKILLINFIWPRKGWSTTLIVNKRTCNPIPHNFLFIISVHVTATIFTSSGLVAQMDEGRGVKQLSSLLAFCKVNRLVTVTLQKCYLHPERNPTASPCLILPRWKTTSLHVDLTHCDILIVFAGIYWRTPLREKKAATLFWLILIYLSIVLWQLKGSVFSLFYCFIDRVFVCLFVC